MYNPVLAVKSNDNLQSVGFFTRDNDSSLPPFSTAATSIFDSRTVHFRQSHGPFFAFSPKSPTSPRHLFAPSNRIWMQLRNALSHT